MKIIEVAFALLVFNFCMGAVTHSMITPYPLYYESEYVDDFQQGTDDSVLPENISTSSESEQYSSTMNIVDIIMGVTDFGWLYYLIPDGLEDEFRYYVLGVQAFVGFFYAIAIIELFVKRYNILGGNN